MLGIKHSRSIRGSRLYWGALALVFVSLAVLAGVWASVSNAAPTVSTDKPHYFSNETVTITGAGFAGSTVYAVVVVRPDSSIVKGDGTFTAGCDTVLTDGSGGFVYYYQLDGIEGSYEVRVHSLLLGRLRATVKAVGGRLPACSAPAFAQKVREDLPDGLRAALEPLLETVAEYTGRVRAYDRAIERLATERYPETGALRQVPGGGGLTALMFVLTLEDAGRFEKSRQVGAYLGLVPRQRESGESKPQLHITRAGDLYLRKLLVQCAHYIMGPFGPATALRRFGERLAGSGNGARKKRALVAVARKLAVLLHRLWVSGEVYEPWHGCKEGAMVA